MSEIDDIIKKICPHYKKGPVREHMLVYDSTSETLEPIYFYLLDLMNKIFQKDVTKLVDNFASSPGGGHFSEIQGKASQMQQEASRVLGTVNTILKGILNLIYDLREFEIRLSHYEAADSKDPITKEAGLLSLKQVWMDKVDMQRGQGSINALASGNLNFITLRDAFLQARSVEEIDKKMDLNDRVKRILKPRLQEFFEWRKRSYEELKKRYEIEKMYFKGQVNALKLNARWAKPYLKAAHQLTTNEKLSSMPDLVSIFNTVLIQLSLMAKNKVDIEEEVIARNLPRDFLKMKKNIRDFYSVVFVDFNFRGIPNKMGQHYVFGGHAEVYFRSYALNKDEIDALLFNLDESDLTEALKFIQGMTDDSLQQMKFDIDKYTETDAEKKKKEEEKKKAVDANPFTALFSMLTPDKKQDKKESEDEKKVRIKKMIEKGIKPQSYAEKYVRADAEMNAIKNCFDLYDIYKKAHAMPTFPYGGYPEDVSVPKTSAEKTFGL